MPRCRWRCLWAPTTRKRMAHANMAIAERKGGRGPRASHSALLPKNTGSVQSPIVFWEAYKATVRGEIIAGGIAERWYRETRLAPLETELMALEQRYATHLTPDIKKQMNQTREEYNVVTRDEVCQQ
ncbi:hypothetical protein NDU88_006482 [Pleurodeles waltl]|uniref:Uncharacterized protein n=1 Tax=Pleurodeles waltl TaxID=8319 RepID=A0AAV7VM13_PLEWA|nr:hypothetical protein NDU88_006482 [Pleurodeles waltl]